ncbi:Murein DD-endopeptidase MepM [Acaryochloris thomasi RCC1774]|uniref:Murein DD-endopeptidase MepM n=1 Tax=Acaryochloris thomasi RCC1774 TaxID=1764569 RepID=A0A2W1JEX2_9CYAN|nr:M23 family metallopeptidase [Acaryochloris thomasi]PZD70285.1 Murein DD-endopeptidase MepM [Acaryochloris thomasi RCC1774]
MNRLAATSLGVITLALTTLQASAIVDPFERPTLDNLSFGQLPATDTNGAIEIPGGPTVHWERGESPADYLPLGVIMDSLGAGDLTLNEIGDAIGISPGDYTLDDFFPVKWQTLQHLVDAVPELPNYRVADVKPIFDALGGQYADSLIVNLPTEALSQTLDVDKLVDYSIHDIPNLANTPLDHFDRAGWSEIYGIPGLEDLPLSNYPTALKQPFWAKVDIVYGDKESTRRDTITGSVQENSWSVPCEKPCAYLEMTNAHTTSGNLSKFGYHGKHYIAGDFQKVKGGWAGQESNWVGGYEPTGQLPFGDFAKVSASDLTEQKGKGQLRLNYRYCERSFGVTKACTPYGVTGGILSTPFLPFKETGIIPVMALTGAPANNGSPSKEDTADVDKTDPRKAEGGASSPISGINPPKLGSSEQGQSSTQPSPAEEEECEGPPLRPGAGYRITSGYGPRPRPCPTCSSFHKGVDIGTPMGTPLQAAQTGTIVETRVAQFNGLFVKIKACDGWTYSYLHLSEVWLKEGQKVEKGESIAKSGGVGPLAGSSTGPHLHVSTLNPSGTAVDPNGYINF